MRNLEMLPNLLEDLWLDSRIQINQQATKYSLSRQTIANMRKFIWDNHYIHSPTILLNPHAVNSHIFFMEIKTNPTEPRILDVISSMPQITAIDGILGIYSLFLKFDVSSKSDFAEILNAFDRKIAQRSRFHSYRIIETLNVYKLGGFPINPSNTSYTLKEKQIKILDILRKNFNPKKWYHRPDDQSLLTSEEQETLTKLNLSRELSYFIKNGIIQQFTIRLGKTPQEFKTKFYVRIQPQNIGDYHEIALKLVNNPNIIDLFRTGEEAGLLAVVRTKSLKTYNSLIQDLYETNQVLDTHTTVVIDEKLPSIFPPSVNIAKTVLKSI